MPANENGEEVCISPLNLIMVFYRKYRPQTIDELDNEEVRNTLYSIFAKSSSVPHAFLFSGPKGLGKTSAARIAAKIINCEKHQDLKLRKSEKEIEPCNKCSQCISISQGSNVDVLEIDGASNRGIDEIRDLRDKMKLSPARATKKVYIIDEVHMLTTEAFNALLKTLEEPPSHVVFILCTTELNKVLPTILSRCFQIKFTKATSEELVRSFQRIAKNEKINIDKEALLEIAKLSDGSFRDGAKMLEELSFSFGNKKITRELVLEKYKLAGIENYITQMLENLSQKDTKKAFELLKIMQKQGIEARFFMEKLMEDLHNRMLGKLGVLPQTESEFSLSEIKQMLEMLSKSYMDAKYALLPHMPLEFFIIEWMAEDSGSGFLHAANDAQELGLDKNISESNSNQKLTGAQAISSSFSDGKTTPSETTLEKLFKDFIEKTKGYNHSVAGVLHSCGLKSYDGRSFIIETKYKFHKEKLEENKSRQILENALKDLIGKELKISVVLRPA